MESKIVLITGCSSGLGQDMAERMTQDGYTVVIFGLVRSHAANCS